jgi:hypothetical protein
MRRPSILLLLACLVAATATAAVRATLDTNAVGLGETVRLRLDRDDQASGDPDLTPLRADFDIVSTSSSRTIQITNGSVATHVQAIVMLTPKRAGQLTIPAIDWSGESSSPLPLTVAAGATGTAGAPNAAAGAVAAKKVFLETSVDPPDPYLQEGVHVTVRLFMSEPLYKAGMDFPPSNDALIEQIQADSHRTVQRNGQDYEVVERHYLVFPQRSGPLSLPGPVVAGQIAVRLRNDQFSNDPFADLFGAGAGMMAGTKPIRVEGEPIVLNVRPRPAAAGDGPWVPARDVTLSADWRPDTNQLHVGDPVTLALHLQAEGLIATQLPDLSKLLAVPAGLKAYPDQAKLKSEQHADTVSATRDQTIALIADQPGDYTVPGMRLSWWDTRTNQMHEVTLPARSFKVLPAPPAANAPATVAGGEAAISTARSPSLPAAANGASPISRTLMLWIGVSVALALLWLATMLAWWRARRRRGKAPLAVSDASTAHTGAADRSKPTDQAATAVAVAAAAGSAPHAPALIAPPPRNAAQARTQFHRACADDDAHAARRALLAWVAAAWPGEPIAGLDALAQRLHDEAITARLQELDRACYAGATWQGAALLAVLKDLPRVAGRSGGGGGLAPLYP